MSNDAKQSGFVAFDGSPCPVVLACDDAYGMPLATTLRSLVDANKSAWPIECFVLSDGITDKTQRKVAASLPENAVVIHWVPVELSRFARYSSPAYLSKIIFARLLIGEILPDHVSKVLYLDTDLVVLEDLAPLCLTDMGSSAIAAVGDGFMGRAINQNLAGYERVPRVSSYFNSGVLLIDLKNLREHRICENALDYLTRHPDTPYPDQDALNVACDGQWKALDSRWNFQDHRIKPVSDFVAENRIAIVHFVTNEKPWIAKILSPNADLYDVYRSRTCYSRTLWERCLDFTSSTYTRCKRLLGRWEAGRQVWKHLTRVHAG